MSNKCENMFYDVAQFLEQNNCCKELKKKKKRGKNYAVPDKSSA